MVEIIATRRATRNSGRKYFTVKNVVIVTLMDFHPSKKRMKNHHR